MYTLTDLCCLCLVNSNSIKSILLQDDDGIAVKIKLEYVISEITNLKSDVLKNICTNCLSALNYVHKFKKECLQNLIALNNYIENMSIKTEDKSSFDQPLEMQEVIPKNNFIASVSDEIMQNNNSDSSYSQELKCSLSNSDNSQHLMQQIPQKNLETENVNIKQEPEYLHDEIDIKSDPLLSDSADSEENPRDNFSNGQTHNSDSSSSASEGAKVNGNVISAKYCQCDKCPKIFLTPSALERHNRVHTGEKPFKCSTCQKTFTRSDTLLSHKRTHSGERPYVCDVCNKAFTVVHNLTVHKRIHTNDRPFKCSECPKAFTHSSDLTRHMRIHTGEKSFQCEVCKYKCTQATSLKLHMRVHTGYKPVECKYCSQQFKSKCSISNIKKHMLRAHNKTE